jgi:acyl carrier protein
MNDRLRRLLGDLFDLEPEEIRPDLMLEDIDLWDSLNHLRLTNAIEETFDVRLTMAEIESIDGVGRLLELLAVYGRADAAIS